MCSWPAQSDKSKSNGSNKNIEELVHTFLIDILSKIYKLKKIVFQTMAAPSSHSPSVCLFGGTFDPIHDGHIQIATLAREKLQLDQVLFLPCHQSPHKLDQKSASSEARLKMCELATANLPWAEVSDYEVKKSGTSFSYQTASYFKDLYPHSTLYWLMGTDQWNSLSKWKHPEILASKVTFIICQRGEAHLQDHDYSHHFISSNHPASSTEIRKNIKTGVSSHSAEWLNPGVDAYIKAQQLYRQS